MMSPFQRFFTHNLWLKLLSLLLAIAVYWAVRR
jgi:membrane-associated PAP2 superfamily phosphatase